MCDQGSVVGLHLEDYKSLCAAATVSATLVSIQILTRTGSILTSSRIAQPAEREKVSKIGIRFFNFFIWSFWLRETWIFGRCVFQANTVIYRRSFSAGKFYHVQTNPCTCKYLPITATSMYYCTDVFFREFSSCTWMSLFFSALCN